MEHSRDIKKLISQLSPPAKWEKIHQTKKFTNIKGHSFERREGVSDYTKTKVYIVFIKDESQAVLVIKEAVQKGIPFKVATGRTTKESFIDDTDGLIIDLQGWKELIVDKDKMEATVRGGVLMKEFQEKLSKDKLFAPVAKGNEVGVIPFFVNGGICSFNPLTGYACENIIAARIILADGNLKEASQTENQSLLWVIQGAGRYFGLVTSITIRVYPMIVLGPDLTFGAFPKSTYGFQDFVRVRNHLSKSSMEPKTIIPILQRINELAQNENFIGVVRLTITDEMSKDYQKGEKISFPTFALMNFESLGPKATACQEIVKTAFDDFKAGSSESSIAFEDYSGDLPRYRFAGPDNLMPGQFRRVLRVPIPKVKQQICVRDVMAVLEKHWEYRQKIPEQKKDTQQSGGRVNRKKKSVSIRDGKDITITYSWEWYNDSTGELADKCLSKRPYSALETAFGNGDVEAWFILHMEWTCDGDLPEIEDLVENLLRVAQRGTRADLIEGTYGGVERISRLGTLKELLDPTGIFGKQFLSLTSVASSQNSLYSPAHINSSTSPSSVDNENRILPSIETDPHR